MALRLSSSFPLDDNDSEILHILETPMAAISSDRAGNASHHPGGGLKAWMQVLSAFFVFFNTW